jgi:HD superfamily phosphodiesterase
MTTEHSEPLIAARIEKYVKTACGNDDNRFTKQFFEEHILIVVKYGLQLAEYYQADREIIRLAGLLHDVSVLFANNKLEVHNVDSSAVATRLLDVYSYDAERIKRVSDCILKHLRPLREGEGTREEVCVSNADAMAQIVRPAYWLYFAFKIRGLSYQEGLSWYKKRITDNWNALVDHAKDLIREEYERIRVVI